jgi:hypothetical protein
MSKISYVSGNLAFSTTGNTLNINSNIVLNIPDFKFSHDIHSTSLSFDIKQDSNSHSLKLPTLIMSNESESDGNLEFTFSLTDIGFPSANFITGLPFDIQNIQIHITEKHNTATIHTLSSAKKLSFMTAPASCLLKGTKVNTVNGWTNIEDLEEGDTVLNQYDEPVEIIKKKSWRIKWGSKDFANTVYKIQAGFCGTVETLYISAYHKILISGQMAEAYTLGLARALKPDICVKDHYVLYNIQLKNYKKNHFSVNGMCLVESWDGSESGIVLTTSEENTIPEKSRLIYVR